MKHQLRIPFIIIGLLVNSMAWSQMTLPPSGGNQKAEVSQWLGIVKVTIAYSSPDVAGREIYGKLVPYGLSNLGELKSTEQNPSPWRVGANENTTITFSHDVEVEGKPLKAGTYGFHLIPGQEHWTVIFSTNSTSWGSFSYDPKEDALRVNVKEVHTEHNEFLTYDFTDRRLNSATAQMKWEKVAVPFKISVPNGKELYVKKLREEMGGLKGFYWQNGAEAADYCANNKVNLDEALSWMQRYIDGGIKSFSVFSAKGNVLTAMGKTADADATMQEAINLPIVSAGQIVGYGRRLIKQNRAKDAMTVFELANKRFPTDASALLGMAQGWVANNDYKKALKYAQDASKATTNPPFKNYIDGLAARIEKGEDINK